MASAGGRRSSATLIASVLVVLAMTGGSIANDARPGARETPAGAAVGRSAADRWIERNWISPAALGEEIERARREAGTGSAKRREVAWENLGRLSVRTAHALEAALALGRRDAANALERLVRDRLNDTRQQLEAISESGDADALFALGLYDARGLLGAANRAFACTAFGRAADRGHIAARFHSALCLLETDSKRAASLMQDAAEAGHPAAHCFLGRACLEKKQAPADADCARVYLGAASDAGRPSAQSLLAWMHATGTGAKQDYARAAELYTAAAKSDDPVAQNNLGEFYEKGTGVAVDAERARDWYERAANAGFAPAQFNLGRLYAQRAAIVGDRSAAYGWLERAHAQGVEPALQVIRWLEAKAPQLSLARSLGTPGAEFPGTAERTQPGTLELKLIDWLARGPEG